MNGQRPTSKKLLVFSVILPLALCFSTKVVNIHSFVTVKPIKIANMDHNVPEKPSLKWTGKKLVIKFFMSKKL